MLFKRIKILFTSSETPSLLKGGLGRVGALQPHLNPPLKNGRTSNGYTLLEALVALSLFLLIIVPFIGQMSSALKFNKGKEMLTASFILEQESAIIQNSPEDIYTTKTRNVNGRNWTVKANVRGEGLKTIKLSAIRNGKRIDEVEFYVHDK